MKQRFIICTLILNISFILNAQIYTPSGTIQGSSGSNNVGIGTANPGNKLTVQGGHYDSGLLLHSTGNGTDLTQADLMLWASEPGISWTGVGISNNIYNSGDAPYFVRINSNRGGSYIRLLDNAMSFNVVSNSGTDKRVMVFDGNGNIGIGTSSPVSKLDVSGNIALNDNYFYFRSGSDTYHGIIYSPAYDGPFLYGNGGLALGTSGGSVVNMVLKNSGNVGIGTTAPNTKLEVNGNIHQTWGDYTNSFYYDADFNVGWKLTAASRRLTIFNSTTDSGGDIVFDWPGTIKGNVGIGTTDPHTKLHIAGSYDILRVGPYITDATGDRDFIDITAHPTDTRITSVNERFHIENIGGHLVLQGTSGNVGIGTTNPQNKLDVNGTIRAKEIKATLDNWSDFVFNDGYKLPSLSEVENFIKTNKHLQNIPSAEDVSKAGVNLGEMQTKLLQKIEELTLYVIQLKKQNEFLVMEIQNIKENK